MKEIDYLSRIECYLVGKSVTEGLEVGEEMVLFCSVGERMTRLQACSFRTVGFRLEGQITSRPSTKT